MSLDARGDPSTFYADDVAYYVTAANDGYSGTLEIARIPDSFRKDVLMETEDETSKVMVENVSAEPKSFALLFEFSGDQKRPGMSCITARQPALAFLERQRPTQKNRKPKV